MSLKKSKGLMLALEIRINDGEPIVAGNESLTYVHISRILTRDAHCVAVTGADDANRYTWIDEDMQDGDKVFIRVIEVDKDEVSSPSEIRKCDRERMKREFERLKQELQEKRLL